MTRRGSRSYGLCATSPTTPTMVSQGDLESRPPNRMCLPMGDSLFHQRSAMRWLMSATLAILMVSDLVMVTKTGSGRIVNFLADRNTGEPVRGAELFLLTRDARKDTAESDANGLAEFKITDAKPDDQIGRAH